MEAKPAEKAALPIITFEHDVTVHSTAKNIRALHFPRATPTVTPSSLPQK